MVDDVRAEPKAVVNAEGRVLVLDPDGNPATVSPGENLRLALQQGYTLEPLESAQHREAVKAQETPAGYVKTAAEGAARGLSVGLSDVALGEALGPEYTKAAALRQEANPMLATGSEFAGMAAPAFLTGGESLVGRTLAATPAGLLGSAANIVERGVARGLEREGLGLAGRALTRGAATAAGGAVEGAGWGLGQSLSQSYLSGEPITAEKVLASVGDTALWGGALGGTLGAVGTVAGEKLAGAAERFGQKQEAQQLGMTAADWRKLAGRRGGVEKVKQRVEEMLDEVKSYTFKQGELAGQKITGPWKKVDEIAPRLDAAVGEVDAQIGGIRQEVSQQIETRLPQMAPRASEAYEAAIRATGLEGNRSAGAREALADVRAQLASIDPAERVKAALTPTNNADISSMAELEELRRALNKTARPAAPAGGGLAAPAPKAAEWLIKAERGLDAYLDDVTKRVLEASGKATEDAGGFAAYMKLQRQSTLLKDARDIANSAAVKKMAGNSMRHADLGMAQGVFLASLFSGNLGASPFGVLHYGLAPAAGALAVSKLARSYGHGVLASMADGVRSFTKRLDAGAAAMAGVRPLSKVTRPILTQTAKQLTEAFNKTADQVNQVNTNPQAMADMIQRRVGDIVPVNRDLAFAMASTIQGDAQYLAAQLPRGYGRGASQLVPKSVGVRMPVGQMRAFMKKAEALSDPGKVVDALVGGDLPREALEALEARRPEIFQELRQMVAHYVATREDELPYKRRVLLSVAFKFDGDWSLQPKNLADIQKAAQPPIEEKPGPKGTPSLDESVADELATPTQKVLQ